MPSPMFPLRALLLALLLAPATAQGEPQSEAQAEAAAQAQAAVQAEEIAKAEANAQEASGQEAQAETDAHDEFENIISGNSKAEPKVDISSAEDGEALALGNGLHVTPSGGVTGSFSGSQVPPSIRLSEEGRQIVGGLIDGFLHSSRLSREEINCLEDDFEEGAAVITSAGLRLVRVAERLLKGHYLMGAKTPGLNPKLRAALAEAKRKAAQGDQQAAEQAAQLEAELQAQVMQHRQAMAQQQDSQFGNSGSVLAVGDIGMSMYELMQIEEGLTTNCVQEDALQLLRTAKKHMLNATFVGSWLLANGEDIAAELADAVIAFRANRFWEFGEDIGRTWRKVVLADASRLPEGMPGKLALENVTAGLLTGFFGFSLHVTATGVLPIGYGAPAAAGSPSATTPANQQEQWNIDLHKCVSENAVLFQLVWNQAFVLLGRSATHRRSHRRGAMGGWPMALALALMQVPRALHMCSIGQEQEEILMETLKGMSHPQLHFQVYPPSKAPKLDEATTMFAEVVEEWATHRWYECGEDMGILLRKVLFGLFPQEYSIDEFGRLRRQVMGASTAHGVPLGVAALQPALGTLLAVALAVPLLAFVVLRVVRRQDARQARQELAAMLEVEGGDEELAE